MHAEIKPWLPAGVFKQVISMWGTLCHDYVQKKHLSCQAVLFKCCVFNTIETVKIYISKSVCSLTDLPYSIWVDDSSHHHCQLHRLGSGTTFAWWGQDATLWAPGELDRHDTVCEPNVNVIKSRWQCWLLIDFTSVKMHAATLLKEAVKQGFFFHLENIVMIQIFYALQHTTKKYTFSQIPNKYTVHTILMEGPIQREIC